MRVNLLRASCIHSLCCLLACSQPALHVASGAAYTLKPVSLALRDYFTTICSLSPTRSKKVELV